MNATRPEALEALAAANTAVRTVRQAIDRQSSQIVLIWAFVYFAAPLCMYLWPSWGVVPQQLLLVSAIAYSIVVCSRNAPISGPTSWRIGGLWWLTFAFGWIWFLILDPTSFRDPASHGVVLSRQMWAYGVSLAMFVYVVMGLWIGRLYVVTGTTVTLLTLVGLLWLGEWYWLWCACTGGGTLLIAGLWLRRQIAE